MQSFTLLLLVSLSAFSASSVSAQTSNNGRLVSRVPTADHDGTLASLSNTYLIDAAFEIVGPGETNIYILTIQQILNDLANQAASSSQALAVSQTIAVLEELAIDSPGDACEAAAVINAYASGNAAAIEQAVVVWVGHLQTSIDLIVQLVNNPQGVSSSTGQRSNCDGDGRTYQLEAVWNAVRNAASIYTLPLVSEEYYAVKRLYNAFNSRSNNVGAAITAASVPQVMSVFQRALTPAANFLSTIAFGGNPALAAAAAKSALMQAASS